MFDNGVLVLKKYFKNNLNKVTQKSKQVVYLCYQKQIKLKNMTQYKKKKK